MNPFDAALATKMQRKAAASVTSVTGTTASSAGGGGGGGGGERGRVVELGDGWEDRRGLGGRGKRKQEEMGREREGSGDEDGGGLELEDLKLRAAENRAKRAPEKGSGKSGVVSVRGAKESANKKKGFSAGVLPLKVRRGVGRGRGGGGEALFAIENAISGWGRAGGVTGAGSSWLWGLLVDHSCWRGGGVGGGVGGRGRGGGGEA